MKEIYKYLLSVFVLVTFPFFGMAALRHYEVDLSELVSNLFDQLVTLLFALLFWAVIAYTICHLLKKLYRFIGKLWGKDDHSLKAIGSRAWGEKKAILGCFLWFLAVLLWVILVAVGCFIYAWHEIFSFS